MGVLGEKLPALLKSLKIITGENRGESLAN